MIDLLRQPDRLADRGVRRGPEEEQLVRAEPQRDARGRVGARDRPAGVLRQREVERQGPPERAVDQLGREAGLAGLERAGLREGRVEGAGSVRAPSSTRRRTLKASCRAVIAISVMC